MTSAQIYIDNRLFFEQSWQCSVVMLKTGLDVFSYSLRGVAMKKHFYYGSFSKTLLLAATMIPVGHFEDFVIDTISDVRRLHKLPAEIEVEIDKLIRDEFQHSYEHKEINKALADDGWNVEDIESRVCSYINKLKSYSLRDRLAYVAVMEVLVGVKAKLFINGHDLIEHHESKGIAQLIKHFEDELKHYKTSIRLYNYLYGSKIVLLKCLIIHLLCSIFAFHANVFYLLKGQDLCANRVHIIFYQYMFYFWLGYHPLFLYKNWDVLVEIFS